MRRAAQSPRRAALDPRRPQHPHRDRRRRGIDTNFTSHSLRHTFGPTLVRDGHDLVLVADLLGHRRLETTRGYSRPTAKDRHRAINSLSTDH